LKLKQLYYKRARGKGVVKLDGYGYISALLREYLMAYPCGKKKGIMYLAVNPDEVHAQGN
jgi:hypothetical protein